MRVDRLLEIDKQGIIGDHHFARASSECIDLYSNGHFIATVMVTQSVNEGIIKFVADRNQINRQTQNVMLCCQFSIKGYSVTGVFQCFRTDYEKFPK